MLIGGHSIIYSTNPDADRAFLRDVLKLTNVDVGGGWLIFGLPPAEVAVHPSDKNGGYDFYLMFDDIQAFVSEMGKRGIPCAPVQDEGWGLLSHVQLPSGGKLGVYQPRHARPTAMSLGGTRKRSSQPAARKRSLKTARRSIKAKRPRR